MYVSVYKVKEGLRVNRVYTVIYYYKVKIKVKNSNK